MAGRDLDADFLIGASKGVKASMTGQHYKYPQTVGQDTIADNVNFNSHDSSEYAIKRSNLISEATSEPFMLFEFMTIDQDILNARNSAASTAISKLLKINSAEESRAQTRAEEQRRQQAQTGNYSAIGGIADVPAGSIVTTGTKIKNWIKESIEPAPRNYTGSIALYMPTDIQINDSMVYNEDTRKLGAALNSFASGEDGELVNWVTATDPTVLAAAGATAGIIPIIPAALTAVITGSIGSLVQTEMQRHTGKVMNPNELARYSQTALRTFTFNWTMLPDNEYESDQAAGLIKFFRKSAHAKRTSSTLVTVPDHVVTSFHGAKDMIQLPPCFIESVNVTYNPNNSSFFKRNNAQVEIGLGVTLKEIVPIYAQDVERGY